MRNYIHEVLSAEFPRRIQNIIIKTLTALSRGRRNRAVFFTLTKRCNARCLICNIWQQDTTPEPDLKDIEEAAKILQEFGVYFIQLTGGEPTLHPKLLDIVKIFKDQEMMVNIVSNGIAINSKMAKGLKTSGISVVGLSVDHVIPSVFEKIRGVPKILQKVEKAAWLLYEEGIPVQASICITKLNWQNLKQILDYLEEKTPMKVVTFDYPQIHSVFGIGSSNPILIFSWHEWIEVFETILQLKKQGYKILNPSQGLKMMIDFAKGKRGLYPCLGGYKIFWLDWELNLRRCMMLEYSFGPIKNLQGFIFPRLECDDCTIECFRDTSIFFYGLSSIGSMTELLLLDDNLFTSKSSS
jgi:MoaA/NifB/PqqE/SkfB family radical SAM enzyme